MRSVGVAAIVALVILRAASRTTMSAEDDNDDSSCGPYICGPGEQCVPSPENVPFFVECASIGTPVPPTETTTVTTTKFCPYVTCGPYCNTNWKDGADGCQHCDCQPEDACRDGGGCAEYEICVPVTVYCNDYSCFYRPSCSPSTSVTTPETTTGTTKFCPYVTCGPNCNANWKVGADGCQHCDCQPEDACRYGGGCSESEICVPVQVYCNDYSCFYRPSCIPSTNATTNTVTAMLFPCPTGRPCREGCQTFEDDRRCRTCYCPTSCEGITCAEGARCELKSDFCGPWDPCPQAVCVQITETTTWTTTETTAESTTESTTETITDTTPETTTWTTTESTIWTTTKPTIMCALPPCDPECVYEPAQHGCMRCVCPCQDFVCLEGEVCVQEKDDSGMEPHFLPPKCVTINVTTPETTTGTTKFCPYVTCGPYCNTNWKVGADGCQHCDCQPEDACMYGGHCAESEICVPQIVSCNEYTCFYIPTCRQSTSDTTTGTTTFTCPPGQPCREGCQRTSDSHGCHTCYCPTSCESVSCPTGQQCDLQYTSCYPWELECGPVAVCVQIPDTTTPCPLIKCAPYCLPDTGPDGCPSCNCPPSCQTVKCSAGYECQLVNGTCDVDVVPCFPQPQCVPTDPCTGSPNKRICGEAIYRWTYNSLTDKCKKFLYYGCTPSPNTFSTRKACKNRCKPICAPVVCEPDCYTLTRKNKCPKCICPNPCKGFRCRAGFECKMRETKCGTTAEPYCARIRNSCPPPEPCAIRCAYGLKTDKNGCQLCECLKKPLPSANSTLNP